MDIKEKELKTFSNDLENALMDFTNDYIEKH